MRERSFRTERFRALAAAPKLLQDAIVRNGLADLASSAPSVSAISLDYFCPPIASRIDIPLMNCQSLPFLSQVCMMPVRTRTADLYRVKGQPTHINDILERFESRKNAAKYEGRRFHQGFVKSIRNVS